MKKVSIFIVALYFISTHLFSNDENATHLILLTGDSHITRFDESISFVPTLRQELGENVIVTKVAYERKHMGHWVQGWVGKGLRKNFKDYAQGWILDELIEKAIQVNKGKKILSLTIVWQQGNEDAKAVFTSTYKDGFIQLKNQLQNTFGGININSVIGRLGLNQPVPKKPYQGWDELRNIQKELGESLPNSIYVNTDKIAFDHRKVSSDYHQKLGEAFAEATIKLIQQNKSVQPVTLSKTNTSEVEKLPAAHLFLLSGQSNMANLDPKDSFIPTVLNEFPEDEVIFVKAAYGAKSISHWIKWSNYDPAKPNELERNWLYKELIGKTKFLIKNREIKTITLSWMQGEADATRKETTQVYARNFQLLLNALKQDLGRNDIQFVMGRLSDLVSPENPSDKFEAWLDMRKIQEQFCDQSPNGLWIDTDEYNGPKNVLHYTDYPGLGKSFAIHAIELAKKAE